MRGFLSFTTSRHSIFVSVSLFFESRYSNIVIILESKSNRTPICAMTRYTSGVLCVLFTAGTRWAVRPRAVQRAHGRAPCDVMRFPLDVVLSPTSLSIKMQASSTTARASMRCYGFTASNASSPCVPALCPPAPLPSEHASELCKTADLTVSFQASRGPAGPFAELSIP